VTNDSTGDDVEFLSNACAEDAREMRGISSGECGGIVLVFVGDPAAAGHSKKILGARYWVLGLNQ
jgi:hypothetical protein